MFNIRTRESMYGPLISVKDFEKFEDADSFFNEIASNYKYLFLEETYNNGLNSIQIRRKLGATLLRNYVLEESIPIYKNGNEHIKIGDIVFNGQISGKVLKIYTDSKYPSLDSSIILVSRLDKSDSTTTFSGSATISLKEKERRVRNLFKKYERELEKIEKFKSSLDEEKG